MNTSARILCMIVALTFTLHSEITSGNDFPFHPAVFLTSNTITLGDNPERQKDEVYLGNVTWTGFKESGWQTKRVGWFAYDENGKLIGCQSESNRRTREMYPPDCIWPLFVTARELREAGYTINR